MSMVPGNRQKEDMQSLHSRRRSLGKECTIFGDGTQVRDFIHVHDLVRIIGHCLETNDLPREMNVASGTETSLIGFG